MRSAGAFFGTSKIAGKQMLILTLVP